MTALEPINGIAPVFSPHRRDAAGVDAPGPAPAGAPPAAPSSPRSVAVRVPKAGLPPDAGVAALIVRDDGQVRLVTSDGRVWRIERYPFGETVIWKPTEGE